VLVLLTHYQQEISVIQSHQQQRDSVGEQQQRRWRRRDALESSVRRIENDGARLPDVPELLMVPEKADSPTSELGVEPQRFVKRSSTRRRKKRFGGKKKEVPLASATRLPLMESTGNEGVEVLVEN
jgi:hypothetical protein